MPGKTLKRTHFPDKILLVPLRIKEERAEICNNCAYFNTDKQVCNINAKFMPTMHQLRGATCPMGQWSSYYGR